MWKTSRSRIYGTNLWLDLCCFYKHLLFLSQLRWNIEHMYEKFHASRFESKFLIWTTLATAEPKVRVYLRFSYLT